MKAVIVLIRTIDLGVQRQTGWRPSAPTIREQTQAPFSDSRSESFKSDILKFNPFSLYPSDHCRSRGFRENEWILKSRLSVMWKWKMKNFPNPLNRLFVYIVMVFSKRLDELRLMSAFLFSSDCFTRLVLGKNSENFQLVLSRKRLCNLIW